MWLPKSARVVQLAGGSAHVLGIPNNFIVSDALRADEYAWNAYPYFKTIANNQPFFKDKFEIVVSSMHLNDAGTTNNVFELNERQLN